MRAYRKKTGIDLRYNNKISESHQLIILPIKSHRLKISRVNFNSLPDWSMWSEKADWSWRRTGLESRSSTQGGGCTFFRPSLPPPPILPQHHRPYVNRRGLTTDSCVPSRRFLLLRKRLSLPGSVLMVTPKSIDFWKLTERSTWWDFLQPGNGFWSIPQSVTS